MPRADVVVAQTTALVQFTGGGTEYIVTTPAGVQYLIYVDTGSDLAFRKSFDFGLSWSAPTIIHAGTIIGFTVWYDRWSGIAAGLIHIAHCDSATDDTIYRTINTESADALSTATVVQNTLLTSTAGGSFSITRTRGGNVLLYGVIDAGVEGGFYRLINANVPNGAWDAAKANPEALAVNDKMIMLPGFAANNQDAIGIFWDNSANQISRYLYNDTANTWGETIFGAPDTFTGLTVTTAHPSFAAAVDLANSRVVVVAWNATDAANQDLRCFIVTEGAITATTDVVANATDDCGLCGIAIDTLTGDWYVVWGGNPNGSETWLTSINLYYKVSVDDGATWSAAQRLTNASLLYDITWLTTSMNIAGPGQLSVAYHNDITLDEIMCNAPIPPMPASYQSQGVQAA